MKVAKISPFLSRLQWVYPVPSIEYDRRHLQKSVQQPACSSEGQIVWRRQHVEKKLKPRDKRSVHRIGYTVCTITLPLVSQSILQLSCMGFFNAQKFQQASIPHLSAAYHLGWRNTSTKQYLRASWEPKPAWGRALMIRTSVPACFGAHPDGYSS